MKDKKSNFQFEIPAEGHLDIRIRYHPKSDRRIKKFEWPIFFWLSGIIRRISEIVGVLF